MEKTAFKERPYFVESYQVKLAAKKYHEKKCKCAALHGLFHRNKHFGMMENDILRHKKYA